MTSTLALSFQRRDGLELADGAGVQAREFVDFMIGGRSLLGTLAAEDGGHADYMTRIVTGFKDPARGFVKELLGHAPPSLTSGRVLLYICPECSDIGCGGYAVRIEQLHGNYRWSDFAYENGYEEPRLLPHIGPFDFEAKAYQATLDDALRRSHRRSAEASMKYPLQRLTNESS
jgi:hypothetical protein